MAQYGIWSGFEAAHIFPIAHERYWKDENFGRWVNFPTSEGDKINSVQNGLLLYTGVHASLTTFEFSINPDVSFPLSLLKPPFIVIGGRP